jgi:hypothetical protein
VERATVSHLNEYIIWTKTIPRNRQTKDAAHNLIFFFPKSFFSAPHWQQGGIAQLVERQLCKLDVWGSNPHASTSYSKKLKAEKLKSWKKLEPEALEFQYFSVSEFQLFP